MRKANVFCNDKLTGVLTEASAKSYIFRYDDAWFSNTSQPAISLTMPKTKQEYTNGFLFPFFFNMLPEGTNKEIACRLLRIDSDDHFGLLMSVAQVDTIGAVTVKKITS
jgi:HipA-like protein